MDPTITNHPVLTIIGPTPLFNRSDTTSIGVSIFTVETDRCPRRTSARFATRMRQLNADDPTLGMHEVYDALEVRNVFV